MQTPDSTDVSQTPKLAFTVTDTHLIFGTEPVVERAIRTLSSGASTSSGAAKWFTQAKAAIPSVVGLAWMEDTSVSFEPLWSEMKNSQKSTSLGCSMGLDPLSMFKQMGINFELLPDFEVVRRYFGLFTLYGVSTPEGFLFEFKDLSTNGTSN